MGTEMSAGRWVFPIAILAFFLLLVSYLAQFPAAPAPAGAQQRFWRTQPGDNVTVEFSEFYNATHAYLSFTTREDLHNASTTKRSPFGVGFDARPIRIQIPAEARAGGSTLADALLGHRINETFTTPRFERLYGDWSEYRLLNRSLGPFDLVVTIQQGDPTPGGPFNLTQYSQLWGRFLQHPLAPGDEIQCEGQRPWKCRVVALDHANGTLSYRRTVRDAQTLSPADLLSFPQGTPAPTGPLVVRFAGDQFRLDWALKVGEAFVLQSTQGDWTPGSYRIEAVGPDRVGARYAPQTRTAAHLVGETVWYEVTVLRIERE